MMANFKIAICLILVHVAIIDGIVSECWQFDSSFSGWVNNGWQQAPGQVPNTEDIDFYNPPTNAYAWLQEQVHPPRAGTLKSPTIPISDGDVVSATFYRHMTVMDGTDRINMTFYTGINKKRILWTENYDTWDNVEITCSPADIHCCPTYPCNGYFVIEGAVVNQNDLVAVNHVGINCDAPPTTPSKPSTSAETTPEAKSTTSIASTTETSTPTKLTEKTTTTESSEKPITTELTEKTTKATEATTIKTKATTVETEATTKETEEPTLVTELTKSEALTTPKSNPTAYCCTFDSGVCDWSVKYVSNGWHWSYIEKPTFIPPFNSGNENYIWVQDSTASVSSTSINDATSGTSFSLYYYFINDNPSENVAYAFFGNVYLGQLSINSETQMFNYTCGNECCGEMISCSGQFTIEVHNEPGTKLLLAIDEFHVNDQECT